VVGLNRSFWLGKNVFITGYSGFKGSWLCLWLHSLGARLSGYALQPPTCPSLFDVADIGLLGNFVTGDVRNADQLHSVMRQANPDVVFHLAAQPLVLESYRDPAGTYETNVMGTVNLFEAVRRCPSVKAVVNVTTDKCYVNKEWVWGYREQDPLGGYDPYSSSKSCSELVTAAYRSSFFSPATYAQHGVAVATARAGNVLGGGDWAADRLVPDILRAFTAGAPAILRNPNSVRPWQHVLEPLGGYLLLAEKLYSEGVSYAEGWNFGPTDADARPVEWMARTLCEIWGAGASYESHTIFKPHEARYLKLDCSKAAARLGWHPRWQLRQVLGHVVMWMKSYQAGADMRQISLQQIHDYEETMVENT
jgi:CDP-glucose 4,6-dehydratase